MGPGILSPGLCLVVLVGGCGGGADRPTRETRPSSAPPTTSPAEETDALGGSTGDTGADPVAQTVTADCQPYPNHALRFSCTLTVDPAGPVTLAWGPEGGALERSARSEAVSTAHTLALWGVYADATWRFVASADHGSTEGTVRTGPLPAELQAGTTVTGATTSEAFLIPLLCAPSPTLALLDGAGRVRGYQRYTGSSFKGGFSWADAGLFVAAIDQQEVWVHTPWGEEILHLSTAAGHFSGPLHHDLFWSPAGLLYLMQAGVYQQGAVALVLDSILVFDGPTQVGRWDLAGHVPFDPVWAQQIGSNFWQQEFPGAVDYSHGNAVTVDGDGEMYLSFRYLSAVYKVAGDPAAPDFGQVRWRLTGDPASPVPSDFQITSINGFTPRDFKEQHHPNPTPEGRLGLFDNRAEPTQDSRALYFDLDPAGGTADIAEVYETGRHCPIQGAAYGLPGGNRLVSCPRADEDAVEFTPGGQQPVFTVSTDCDETIRRVIPLTLPDGL